MPLVLADDWPGAWDDVPGARPDDWREVTLEVPWDVAELAAGWATLEAAHQRPLRQRSIRRRLHALAEVIRADLPFLLGVGPSAPRSERQPALPLVLPDDPPLERLADRPPEGSWRTSLWLGLQPHLDLIVQRARPALASQAGEDGVDPEELGPGSRAEEDHDLAERLCEQVALQLEILLREQAPTVLPLFEESVALVLEDAALGAALHVETRDDGGPVAVRFVSHDGRARAPVSVSGTSHTPLRALLATAGAAALHPMAH